MSDEEPRRLERWQNRNQWPLAAAAVVFLVSRHYTPPVSGYYILHEGLLGVLNGGLNEITYEDIREAPSAKLQRLWRVGVCKRSL